MTPTLNGHQQTLYKKTGQKIMRWTIVIEEGRFMTISGYTNGALTESEWTYVEKKNVGKSNETSLKEQAMLEAIAKITKKKEEGYTEDINNIDKAKAEAWLEPMLAYDIEKKVKKVKAGEDYLAQPKLDGLRCVATMDGFFSRNGKPFVSLPHVFVAAKNLLIQLEKKGYRNVRLDGELYNHDYKGDFNTLVSLIRKGSVLSPEDQAKIQYHIYDLDIPDTSYATRLSILESSIDTILTPELRLVETRYLNFNDTTEDIIKGARGWEEVWVEQGYEGAMLRHAHSIYEHKRSEFLLKVKSFQEEEFEILDIEEGSGNRSGMAGNLIVKVHQTDKTSESGIAGGVEFYKWLWENKFDLIGKKATVRFFGFTPAGKLRFPVTKTVDRAGVEG